MEKRFPELLGEEGKRFIRRKQEIYAELLEEKPPPLMPGVEAFLDALERGGRTRCVVTNSLRSHVDIVRRTSPALQKIPLWLTREDYARPKPAADGYQAALLHTECQAVHAVGFEDTIKGVKALAGAGIQAIWICPKHQLQEEACQELKAQHFESFLHINI